MADKDSKTEKATPKRRRDLRKEGNVFLSKDVISVITMLGMFFILQMTFPQIYADASDFMKRIVSEISSVNSLDMGTLQKLGMDSALTIFKSIAALLAVSVLLAVLSAGIQTRFLFSKKKIAPKLSNISPLKGIKNIMSVKNLVELLKGILKVIIIFAVLYNIISKDITDAIRTMDMDIKHSAAYMLNMTMDMVITISVIFLVVAAADFFFQRWEFEKNARMSKQEVKDEFKEIEGNPEIKGRIKNIQQQRARNRMMQAVPEADVIIRNPTHFAVALKYNADTDNAPVLVAKGQDELALRIVKVAQENHVYIVENKVLARGIYATTPLGGEISPDYYGVVAEILVEVFRANQKSRVGNGVKDEKTNQ